jgi:hypothetical protein
LGFSAFWAELGMKKTKIVIAAVVFCTIIGGATYYVGHADSDHRPGSITIGELDGVRLGMSPTDVTVSLGKPFASSKLESDGSGRAHLTYVYTKPRNEEYALNITFFGRGGSSPRAVVICEQGGFVNLLGFDKFSREQDVLRLLGQPSYSSVRADGLEKAISYSAWNASFKIARGNIVALCIHQGHFIQYDQEVPAAHPLEATAL